VIAGPAPLRHIKLTEHALDVASRRLTPPLREPFARALLDGTLLRLARDLAAGERGAFALAGGGALAAIVFCRDEHDQAVVAVLTVLGEHQVTVLSRRRDTRLVAETTVR
jgi:hypothetical protein